MQQSRGFQKFATFELFLILLCILLFFVMTSVPAHAAVTLTWVAPTTRVNGAALSAAEIGQYAITKNGAPLATVPGNTLTYSDASSNGCVADTWALVAIDTGALFSAAATATTPVDKVQCAPKPPTGFSVH